MTCLFKRQRRIAGRRDGSRQALQRPSSCTPISPLSSPLRLKCCPDHVHLANAPRHMPQLRPALDQAKSENPIASACGPRVPAWVALRRQTASQTLHHFGNPEPNLYFPKAATPPLGLGAIRLHSESCGQWATHNRSNSLREARGLTFLRYVPHHALMAAVDGILRRWLWTLPSRF